MAKKWILLLALIGALTAMVSCEKQDTQKAEKPMLAFVINVPRRFWDLAYAGCLKAAQEENTLLEFHVPGQSSAAQQIQIVESLIAKGCDGLAISPLSPESFGRVIDKAVNFMPVLCQDSDCPDSQRRCYIGTDNVAAGREAGKQLLAVLPEGGEVAVFVGKLDVGNARERFQGVKDALEGSKCTIVDVFTDQADRSRAQSNVRTAVAKYPNIKGIVGLWGYNGFLAVSALADKPGHNIQIVGFDEDIETIAAIRDGKMVCSVVQNPYEFGYQSIKMLAKIHRGEPVDIPENKMIYVPVRVLNKDNVDTIEADINQKIDFLNTTLKK